MDNLNYQSTIVKDWCERFHVCPEGRLLASSCADLRTVWWNIDRPAWLVWFYAMALIDDPKVCLSPVPKIVGMLAQGDPMRQLCNGNPWSVNDVEHVDSVWCSTARELVDCPFGGETSIPGCTMNPDGSITIDEPAQPDVAAVAGFDPYPREGVIERQQAILGHVTERANFWRNAASFMVWGAYFGVLAGYLIARLVNRNRAHAIECERINREEAGQ